MSERINPKDMPFEPRMCADYDPLIEYVEDLHELCRSIVDLRGQGWQKRGEMHDAISKLANMIGVNPQETKTKHEKA